MTQEELVKKKNQLLIERKEKSLEITEATILGREDLALLEADLYEINGELDKVRAELFMLMFAGVENKIL